MTELTERVGKARLEVNTAKLASARAESAIDRGDTVKAKAETHAAVLAQRRSVYAIDAMAEALAGAPPVNPVPVPPLDPIPKPPVGSVQPGAYSIVFTGEGQ